MRKPAQQRASLCGQQSHQAKEETMKKLVSCTAALLLVAGLSAVPAEAKSKAKSHHTGMTSGSATGGNSANSGAGKNSPASSSKGSASSAGGGEK
jgi:hypothetical protein